MTFRGHEDTISATSEAYSPDLFPGAEFPSKSSDVESWCHSLQLPPTPESFSDSDLTGLPSETSQDFFEMGSPYDWPQCTSSDEIVSVTSMADDRKTMAFPMDAWSSQGMFTKHETSVSDNATWLTATQGSVAGVSPVLSHMSQNSHSLISHSGDFCPDFYLAPGDPYPVTGDFQWPALDNLSHGSFLPQDACSSLTMDAPTDSLPVCYPEQISATCAPHLSVPCLPIGEMKRSSSEPNVAQGRRLLPRTPQAPPLSRSQSGSQYRAIQPQLPALECVDSKDIVGSATVARQGPVANDSHPSSGNTLDTCSTATSYEGTYPVDLPAPMMTPAMVPDVFQQVPMDNFSYYPITSSSMTRSLSHMSAFDPMQPLPLGIASGNVQTPMIKLDSGFRVTSLATTSPNEGEEGRYRTDPLYKSTAQSDGLYHCPFVTKPGQECSHKPTKLKCNYDKYIDSHLKPFRCKDSGCAKQLFSSMACVLRHEREAHGLHGHGERPFPCHYAGCDRALPHNGFPRKYNLCDHMRRVHGWKDEAAEDQENAALGGSTAGKKANGRKRKASNAAAGNEPSTRKIKNETNVGT